MLTMRELGGLPFQVRTPDTEDAGRVKVTRTVQGSFLSATAENISESPVKITELALIAGRLPVADGCAFYGEGFQMLTQYTGTLDAPRVIGHYGADNPFFGIPENRYSRDLFTVYNCLYLAPEGGEKLLMAFTSSHKFAGQFRFRGAYVEAVMDCEGIALQPGEVWQFEEFALFTGTNRDDLFEALAERLNFNHPPIKYAGIPFGWCSFHCINGVKAEDMYREARAMRAKMPELKRIQIDDGYSHLTDWLIPNPASGADMPEMCAKIRAEGCEPAGYLAPFIVDKDSKLFHEHPDWVVCDEDGKPFNKYTHVDRWYMLDGSNPEAAAYIRHVVRTMHDEWGIRYFKLDFTSYGALPGGVRHGRMTRIQAFRALFGAIAQEVGADSYILGCNAPFWPQLGLVHGNRETNDVFRDWESVRGNAEELFWRNWQNGRLWINDPDGVVLEKRDMSAYRNGVYRRRICELSDAEFDFHRAYIVASGGVITSGDLLSEISDRNIDALRKMMAEAGQAARFDDDSFRVGRIEKDGYTLICAFNWADEVADIDISLDSPARLSEFFSERSLGTYEHGYTVKDALPHQGFVIKAVYAENT